MHNVGIYFWCLDPRVPADASTVTETALRCLERLASKCEELEVPFPEQLIVWAAGLHGCTFASIWLPLSPPSGFPDLA